MNQIPSQCLDLFGDLAKHLGAVNATIDQLYDLDIGVELDFDQLINTVDKVVIDDAQESPVHTVVYVTVTNVFWLDTPTREVKE